MAKAKPLPLSIKQVETAVPVFIGFTEKHKEGSVSLLRKPVRISSQPKYEACFGSPASASLTVYLKNDNSLKEVKVTPPSFLMHYALRLYFANGGGPCFIVSAGTYKSAAALDQTGLLERLQKALTASGKEDSITLLVFPDASLLTDATLYHRLLHSALENSAAKRDRFAILDVPAGASSGTTVERAKHLKAFCSGIGTDHLSYGAVYYPFLYTTLPLYVNEQDPASLSTVGGTGLPKGLVLRKEDTATDLAKSLFHRNRGLYDAVKAETAKHTVILPPSAAVAGVYATVDSTRGVWKAPANVALQAVKEPAVIVNEAEAQSLNVDPVSGISINTIRAFPGRGVLVWGARTLAGNDNEWRYVPVRRFFNAVEESVRKGTEAFVFEPNNENTWTKVRSLVESFLVQQWQAGALKGTKPEQAFYVKVGLGQSMTAEDIAAGRLVMEIGMAPLRPAEFVILRITHMMKKP